MDGCTALWHKRDDWLSLLEELFDPPTTERLASLGVGPGWRALDVGAGRGSIAAWLADRIGPGGEVVATDLDTSLLEELGDSRVEVLRHDVLADGFPPASFDLVHCRYLLLHLSDPARGLERMTGWLRPGGVLLAEEPWIEVARLSPEPVMARAADSLAQEVDVGFARRLPTALREVGLERVRVETDFGFFEGGTRRATFFRRMIEGACAPLVASRSLDAGEVRRFLRRFDDPDFRDCGWPRIAAVGWKPGFESLASAQGRPT